MERFKHYNGQDWRRLSAGSMLGAVGLVSFIYGASVRMNGQDAVGHYQVEHNCTQLQLIQPPDCLALPSDAVADKQVGGEFSKNGAELLLLSALPLVAVYRKGRSLRDNPLLALGIITTETLATDLNNLLNDKLPNAPEEPCL